VCVRERKVDLVAAGEAFEDAEQRAITDRARRGPPAVQLLMISFKQDIQYKLIVRLRTYNK